MYSHEPNPESHQKFEGFPHLLTLTRFKDVLCVSKGIFLICLLCKPVLTYSPDQTKTVARVIMQIVTKSCKNVTLLISGKKKKKIRFVENLLLSTLHCYLYYSHQLFLFHVIVLAENGFNISLYCTGEKWHSINNVRIHHTKCK